jgi:pimeloyl-ACP methyl ester carboxylesterase
MRGMLQSSYDRPHGAGYILAWAGQDRQQYHGTLYLRVVESTPLMSRPVNWYRQRRTNWEEDRALLDKKVIKQPVLFIQATYDSVLKPEMSKSMDSLIPNLTRGEVAATHWALTQKPEEVNQIVRQWLDGQGLGKTKSTL